MLYQVVNVFEYACLHQLNLCELLSFSAFNTFFIVQGFDLVELQQILEQFVACILCDGFVSRDGNLDLEKQIIIGPHVFVHTEKVWANSDFLRYSYWATKSDEGKYEFLKSAFYRQTNKR